MYSRCAVDIGTTENTPYQSCLTIAEVTIVMHELCIRSRDFLCHLDLVPEILNDKKLNVILVCKLWRTANVAESVAIFRKCSD